MERHDPLLLATAHTRPALDGLLGIAATVLVVADDAPQQAVVVGTDPVVVVDIECRERRHKDSELLLIGNETREFGIQTVDALQEQDVTILEFEGIA